jgi:putative radical SAM enzyme (TIGR03279 family)
MFDYKYFEGKLMKYEHIVKNVQPDSIAEEMGIEAGDKLISINDNNIEDVFDYHFYVNDEEIVLLIEKPDGEQWELEIEKDYEEDLGIEFESGLMDEYRSCRNKCIFCFIDQMPKGMRETLYFKDDDSRLSFLQGNYITLTNMSDHDIDRIINYHLEPINISFHTTNPKLRCQMLNNRFAGDALKKVDKLFEAGIMMNGQIVLCKGYNDGEELERSIHDLSQYLPHLQSVSVVPVGLTKYRDGLCELESFTKEDAIRVLDTIEKWQRILYEAYGNHFIHAGDEWYILAEREIPDEDNYDGYLQLENGVGMLRLMMNEFEETFMECKASDDVMEVSVATGVLAYPYLEKLTKQLSEKYPNLTVHLYPIKNEFFGEKITVAGLVTGKDLIAQLQGKPLGSRLLLPCNMFRSGEEVFLDDTTLTQVKDSLQVEVDIVKSSGRDFIEAIVGERYE